jgi:23S rRNA pseudouridine1911/1915/1917 synthase
MSLVPPESPERLDRFLVQRLAGMSRARAAALIAEGRVRVNGRRGVKGTMVGPNDAIEVEGEVAPPDWTPRPDPDVPLAIAYEDDDLLVVDKPGGVPSHPLKPDETGTVASWLSAHRPGTHGVGYGPREPGLVHRLDVGTSGLLLVAKNAAAFEKLRSELKAGAIEKTYLAVVAGTGISEDPIAWPIDDSSGSRVRVLTDERLAAKRKARPAETTIEIVRTAGERTLVRAIVAKAVRHQVRAHLAAAGHPLLGDETYGGPAVPGLSRHALHAASIELEHPADGRIVRVSSPLPQELERLL